jgi:asparagine N-glycosylation enzyme membrane subunit Stt3
MKFAVLSTYFWTQNEKTLAFFHARFLSYPPTSPLPFHTLICYAIVSTGVIFPLLPSAPHHKQRFMEQTRYLSL